jgi:dTDP-4-amino-4,6-dideoxygalactose transaminase
MDAIMDIAERHGLIVIEDAAQGVMSSYKGRPLGSIGHLACLSFHETKNLSSGEGGALLINDAIYALRAEIIREKGTNRSQFFRGQVDKYTWCDLGSSYLPSELNAAFLMAQMEEAQSITRRRLQLWQRYHEAFAELEQQGRLRRPQVPGGCEHNAHMYYLLLPDLQRRTAFIEAMRERDIGAVFHYVPLHSAPAGQRYGRAHEDLEVTQSVAERLVRLPLWVGLESDIDEVISSVAAVLNT